MHMSCLYFFSLNIDLQLGCVGVLDNTKLWYCRVHHSTVNHCILVNTILTNGVDQYMFVCLFLACCMMICLYVHCVCISIIIYVQVTVA